MKGFTTVVLTGALAASFSPLALAQASPPETWRESAWQSCAEDDNVRCENERAGWGSDRERPSQDEPARRYRQTQ